MTYPTFQIELEYLKEYDLIAGVDEAGRGPLAGPVVAGAVILDPKLAGARRTENKWWRKVRDAKLLSEKTRIELEKVIKDNALALAVGRVEAQTIDKINILEASLLAMRRAVMSLGVKPELLLVDGLFKIKKLAVAQEAIVKGDQKILSIAAASIIAKVYRDNLMKEMHQLYPRYGFDQHKGYATAQHWAMIARFGPCPIHRLHFLAKTARKMAR